MLPWVSFYPGDPRQHVLPVSRGLCLIGVQQTVSTSVVRALEYENLKRNLESGLVISTDPLANLGVVIQSTEKGCVENKKSTEQPLVEAELPHLAENAVESHLCFISNSPDQNSAPSCGCVPPRKLNFKLRLEPGTT